MAKSKSSGFRSVVMLFFAFSMIQPGLAQDSVAQDSDASPGSSDEVLYQKPLPAVPRVRAGK